MSPKFLLLSKKEEVPGAFKALAINFQGLLQYGYVNAAESPDVAAQMQITKFPSAVLMVPQRSPEDEGRVNFGIQPYVGPMSYAGLAAFVAEITATIKAQTGASAEEATQQAIPNEVVEVTTNAEFEVECVAKGGLCVVGFLDATAAAASDHVQILKDIAAKRAGQPFTFSWVDVARQYDFATAFEVRATDAPTVVVLSARKLRYAPLRGPFTMQEVDTLLQGVATGRVSTQMIQELPKLVDGGADPVAQEEEVIEEEEFDLADIMGEEVEQSISTEDRLKQAEKEIEEEKKRAKEAAEEKKKLEEEAAKKSKKKKSKKSKKAKKATNEEL